jgi:hypothetical protein
MHEIAKIKNILLYSDESEHLLFGGLRKMPWAGIENMWVRVTSFVHSPGGGPPSAIVELYTFYVMKHLYHSNSCCFCYCSCIAIEALFCFTINQIWKFYSYDCMGEYLPPPSPPAVILVLVWQTCCAYLKHLVCYIHCFFVMPSSYLWFVHQSVLNWQARYSLKVLDDTMSFYLSENTWVVE